MFEAQRIDEFGGVIDAALQAIAQRHGIGRAETADRIEADDAEAIAEQIQEPPKPASPEEPWPPPCMATITGPSPPLSV